MWAQASIPTVITERKALTLKKPILFPAEVNRIELPLHRKAVIIAAEFPMKFGSTLPLGLIKDYD